MKTQLRGNCPCCGRLQAVVSGTMSKHGYVVKHGWFQGVCTGNKYAPMQLDRAQTDKIIESVILECNLLKEKVERYSKGASHPAEVPEGPWSRAIMIPWERADDIERQRGLEQAINALKNRIQLGLSFAGDLKAILDKVHGQPLLEVKIQDKPRQGK